MQVLCINNAGAARKDYRARFDEHCQPTKHTYEVDRYGRAPFTHSRTLPLQRHPYKTTAVTLSDRSCCWPCPASHGRVRHSTSTYLGQLTRWGKSTKANQISTFICVICYHSESRFSNTDVMFVRELSLMLRVLQ